MQRQEFVLGVIGLMILSGCVSSSQYRKSQNDLTKCVTDKQGLQQQVDALNTEKANLTQTAQAKEEEINKLKGTYDQLVGSLKNEIANGEIQVTQLKDKLTLNLVEKILFDSGRAQIKDTGKEVLDRIGNVLKTVQDKDIRIEGHTDNVPVGRRLRETYPTNWELSTARATNVVRYLQEKDGVDPTRLIAAGFSEFHPVASNDTPEGQAQNRRIDIVLVARDVSATPPPTPAASSDTTKAPEAPATPTPNVPTPAPTPDQPPAAQ
jgi:chemotaxis protein MotB